jgi:hypothetical protein
MGDRNSKGQFAPGNKASVGRRNPNHELKKKYRQFLDEVPELLSRKACDIDEQINHPEVRNWEKFALKKIKDGDRDFIKWAFEMCLGKPSQNVEMQTSDEDKDKLKEEIEALREVLSKKHKSEY